MTTISYHGSHGRPSPLSALFHNVTDLPARLRQEWRLRQTQKMLESLPAEIRKDIGWPTSDASNPADLRGR